MKDKHNIRRIQKTQCKLQEITIITWALNAKVGKEKKSEIVDKFKLGTWNERGER